MSLRENKHEESFLSDFAVVWDRIKRFGEKNTRVEAVLNNFNQHYKYIKVFHYTLAIKNKALQEVFQRENSNIERMVKDFRNEFKSGEINFNSKVEQFSKSLQEYHEQVENVKNWNK